MRCLRIAVCALMSLSALALISGRAQFARASSSSAKVAVSIENYAFQPDPVTVSVGTTVTWTNHDEVTHSVVSSDKLFSSPELEVNHSFDFTFQKAGTYPYFCSIHPEMKGKVIVK